MLWLLAVLLPALAGAPSSTLEEVAPVSPEIPVHFRGERLFGVRAAAGKLAPAERAAAIEERLRTIAAAADERAPGTVRQQERETSVDLLVGDSLVLTVQDGDAAPLGRTRQQLAAENAAALRQALSRELRDRSWRGILTSIAIALGATLVLLAALRGLRWAGPRLERRVLGTLQRSFSRPRWQRFGHTVLDRAEHLLLPLGRTLSWLAAVALVAIYGFTVLAVFPWTRAVAVRARDAALATSLRAGSGIVDYLPNLLSILVIAVISRLLLLLGRIVFDELGRRSLVIRGFHAEWARPTYEIVRFLVLALAAVAVFPYLPGAQSPAFQGVSIFVGVLLSFGSSSAISNVVAGVALTYMRPFSIGDRVQIAETIGDVLEKNLLVVRVRTIKNVDITIANSMVLGNHIVNYSACAHDSGLILHTSVTIGYDRPWRQIHELLIAAARSTEGVRSEPAPFVLQTSLDDFFVSYEINAYTDLPNHMVAIRSRLHGAIQDHFFEAGVEILSPHYTALRDGSAPGIPPKRP